MTKEQAVAFLDLLAFSNHVRDNTKDALLAFTTYRTILETKITDDLVHPPTSYSNPILQDLATRHSVNSFNHFLPFSDSVFISSDDPNLFLKQLGSFVLHCFTFTSRQYQNPDDPSNPIKVVHKFKDNTIIEENWYSTLFRGSIALGEAIPIELMGIVNSKPQKIANLAGKAVVRAVGLESKIKGPRIVFEKELFEKLDSSTKVYTAETEVKGLYELLWTGFHYILSNGHSEINDFYELFLPAVNLWKAYNHTPFSEHYFKFVELVVTGTLKVFDANGHRDIAINKVTEMIKSQGLEHKKKQLLKSYSS
ncbi:MAG: hypothetical protein NTX61_07645 [Bacteroidetes bacterium]|nr:hypothetical protein [Bacteroidota bacterium]